MTRFESGTIAATIGVVAATTLQVGEGTIALVITAILVPLATALWREREKRLKAEADLRELQYEMGGAGEDSLQLHEDVLLLRQEVARLKRATNSSQSVEEDIFPRRSRRQMPTRSSSRSPTRSRGSRPGSDDSWE